METQKRKIVAREFWDRNAQNIPVPLEILGNTVLRDSYAEGYELTLNRIKTNIGPQEVSAHAIREGLKPEYALQGMQAAKKDYRAEVERYAPKKEARNDAEESPQKGLPKDLVSIMGGMQRNPGFIPLEFWNLDRYGSGSSFHRCVGTGVPANRPYM